MIKKFDRFYDELRFRATRAFIWCSGEGSELGACGHDLYAIWSLHGIGDYRPGGDSEQIVKIMEDIAAGYAWENVWPGVFVEDAERKRILADLRHLRKTGYLPH